MRTKPKETPVTQWKDFDCLSFSPAGIQPPNSLRIMPDGICHESAWVFDAILEAEGRETITRSALEEAFQVFTKKFPPPPPKVHVDDESSDLESRAVDGLFSLAGIEPNEFYAGTVGLDGLIKLFSECSEDDSLIPLRVFMFLMTAQYDDPRCLAGMIESLYVHADLNDCKFVCTHYITNALAKLMATSSFRDKCMNPDLPITDEWLLTLAAKGSCKVRGGIPFDVLPAFYYVISHPEKYPYMAYMDGICFRSSWIDVNLSMDLGLEFLLQRVLGVM